MLNLLSHLLLQIFRKFGTLAATEGNPIMRPKYLLPFIAVLFIALIPFIPSSVSGQSGVASRISAAIDNTKLTTLHGNVHPMARSEFDRGAAPASLPMDHMQLVLTRSADQQTALETLLAQQQNPSSPNYHNWLTPEQFGQQFGPSDQDIQKITAWLQSQGFQVNEVAKGRTTIDFSGNAGQVQQAFHTAIHSYVMANGEQHWANSTDPQIPAALAPVVAGVSSLNNFPRKPMSHRVHPNVTLLGAGTATAIRHELLRRWARRTSRPFTTRRLCSTRASTGRAKPSLSSPTATSIQRM